MELLLLFPLAQCPAYSRCLIKRASIAIPPFSFWHGDRSCPVPKTYCAPRRCSLVSTGFLASPPSPIPPARPSTRPSHLWLTPASFGFDFSLVWFCFVCYHLLFYFLFPIFCFPAPLPTHPTSLPHPPTFSPPPIEPSAPPQDVKCVSVRSTAILVSWRPPPPETHNGALVGYSVRYRPLGSEDPEPKEVNGIPPTTTQILLEALEKWTQYRITTVAHTEVGPGPESSPVVVRTDEDGKYLPQARDPPQAPARPPPRSLPSGNLGWWSKGRSLTRRKPGSKQPTQETRGSLTLELAILDVGRLSSAASAPRALSLDSFAGCPLFWWNSGNFWKWGGGSSK